MQHHSIYQSICLVIFVVLCSVSTSRADVSNPAFVEETLYRGNGMLSIEFGPSGRMYVAEKVGRILVFQSDGSGGYLAPQVFLDIQSQVFSSAESGLLGMKLDPAFETNRHVYLFHTTQSDQRLIRVTADTTFNRTVANSTVVLLSGLPRRADYHKAGDIQFHPNDTSSIYIAVGDDGGRDLAQNLDAYNGKILRVSKTDGRGFADNPFATSDLNAIRSRVWASGMRNPFRFVFHPNAPAADVMYVSENGDDIDRVARVTRGSNGGWSSAGDDEFIAPSDTNFRVLMTLQPFTTGITVVRGGIFADSANGDVMLVGNASRSGITRYRMSGTNLDQLTALDGGAALITNLSSAPAVDIAIGPDGAAYFTQTNGGASTGTTYTLKRVRGSSTPTGQRPIASFTTNPSSASGPAPLAVTFTDTSSDPDGSIVSRSWSFGDGTTSTTTSPSHTYSASGDYTATLTVTDNAGLTSIPSASASISVGSGVTVTLQGRVVDARTFQVSNLAAATELRLYDGDLAHPIAFSGGVGPSGNGITVNAGGYFNTSRTVQMVGNRLIVSAGEPTADGMQPLYRGALVSSGQVSLTMQTFYLSSMAIQGQVTDTRDAVAVIDIGIGRGSATQWYPVPGGRDRTVNPTRVNHRITTDVLGYYYFPIRTAEAGTTFYLDLLADTNTNLYTGDDFSVRVDANAYVQRPILVGLRNGGLVCDSLSTIATTANVNYETQIKPIFDASCSGCHAPTAADSGGLDLLNDGYANLVGVPSGQVPGLARVAPGDLAGSVLFEKINCGEPQRGDRMRPTDAMTPASQALIRDWILQLAP